MAERHNPAWNPGLLSSLVWAVVFINQPILCKTDVTSKLMSQPVDCLCLSSACNIWKIMKTIWRRWLGMSDIDCSVHRQTAVTVGFTNRELKLLYLWSQIHQTALIKTVILPCGTWELICSCCDQIVCNLCFSVLIHHSRLEGPWPSHSFVSWHCLSTSPCLVVSLI